MRWRISPRCCFDVQPEVHPESLRAALTAPVICNSGLPMLRRAYRLWPTQESDCQSGLGEPQRGKEHPTDALSSLITHYQPPREAGANSCLLPKPGFSPTSEHIVPERSPLCPHAILFPSSLVSSSVAFIHIHDCHHPPSRVPHPFILSDARLRSEEEWERRPQHRPGCCGVGAPLIWVVAAAATRSSGHGPATER